MWLSSEQFWSELLRAAQCWSAILMLVSADPSWLETLWSELISSEQNYSVLIRANQNLWGREKYWSLLTTIPWRENDAWLFG